MLDPLSAQRSRGLLAADELGRYVGVELVHETGSEERGVHLSTTLDQQAEEVALAELVEQVGQRYAAAFGRRQEEDFGQSDSTRLRGCDEHVGPDNTRRLADSQL